MKDRYIPHVHYISTLKKVPENVIQEEENDTDDEEEALDEIRQEFWDTASQASARSKEERDEESKPATLERLYFDFETGVCCLSRHYCGILCVLEWQDGSQKVFKGANAAEDFLDCILSFDYKRSRRYFLGHFASGFDIYCFLSMIYKKHKLKPECISTGQKIICLKILSGRIVFLDSLSFLCMPLCNLPSAFGLKEDKKGFFPYSWLSCREGEDIEMLIDRLKMPSAFPNRDAFDEGGMLPKRHAEFLKWFQEEEKKFADKPYLAWEELCAYCISDCCILRLACEEFARTYKEHTEGVDPFFSGITLTSANFKTFRRNYLKPQSIAIINDTGLVTGLYSRIACVWLNFLAEANKIEIKHAGNSIEQKIACYSVDGYSKEVPRLTHRGRNWLEGWDTVFQFYGCCFHGHPLCKVNREERFLGETMATRYARTVRMEKFMHKKQLNLITIWECAFKEYLRKNEDLRKDARLLGALKPSLKPREGYFGGRCEVFGLMYTCGENERICYYDYCGLYPFIMVTSEYYIGMPNVIRDFSSINLEDHRGLVFGRFLPPAGGGELGGKGSGCFLPILPAKVDQKLYFGLCNECCRMKSQICDHSENERAIQGVYTTEEIQVALAHGYTILELFELWSYPPEARDSEVFNGFIKLFMKLKAEASGFPDSIINNEEACQEYISKYEKKFGIFLDKDKIKKNPTLRTVAKVAANSLYGKLGQKSKRLSVCYATKFDELRRLACDPNVEIHDIFVISNELSLITYSYHDACEPVGPVNLPMCIQTTSYARLALFNVLKSVQGTAGCQILYADTDSCIFVKKDDASLPFESGDVLGDLKDEIEADYGLGSKIIAFTCTGPKSYSYIVQKADGTLITVMRIKGIIPKFIGFRMDSNTSKLITPEVMREMIQGKRDDPVTVEYPNKVVRDIRTGRIRQRLERKKFKCTSDKR